MTSKLLKLILFLFVAFVGIFAMSIAPYTYARQVPGDRESTGDFQPLETSGKRKSSAVPQLKVPSEQGTVKDQLQLQLYAVQAQLEEAKQQFGSNQPEIRMLERQAKLLEGQIKAEAGVAARRKTLPPEQDDNPDQGYQVQGVPGLSGPVVITQDPNGNVALTGARDDVSIVKREIAQLSPESLFSQAKQLELQQKFQRAERKASELAQTLMSSDFSDEESKRR